MAAIKAGIKGFTALSVAIKTKRIFTGRLPQVTLLKNIKAEDLHLGKPRKVFCTGDTPFHQHGSPFSNYLELLYPLSKKEL